MTDLENQITEAKNILFGLEEQIDETKITIDELEKKLKGSKAWPQKGDVYYSWLYGKVFSNIWDSHYWQTDMLERGEIFKTEEDCELDHKKRKILQRIKVLEKGFVPKFSDDEDIYQIYCYRSTNLFYTSRLKNNDTLGATGGRYRTKDDAEDALDALGSANLKILAGIK